MMLAYSSRIVGNSKTMPADVVGFSDIGVGQLYQRIQPDRTCHQFAIKLGYFGVFSSAGKCGKAR